MANFRALSKEFAEAPWQGRGELEKFVERAEVLDSNELAKLLPGLKPENVTLPVRRSRMQAYVMLVQRRRPDPKLFGPLYKAALEGDDPLRRVLMPLIKRHNDVKQHKDVVELLKDPDIRVRQFAAELLKEVGGKQAMQYLAKILEGRGWDSRMEAIQVIIEVGGHHGIEPLGKVVIHGSMGEKLQALKLLSTEEYVKVRRSMALEAMMPALGDPSMQIVGAAIRAIAIIATEDEFLESLGALLEGRDRTKQMYVLQNLTAFPPDRMIPVVEKVYDSGGEQVKEAALRALTGVGDDAALPLLVRALSEESLAVRNVSQEVVIHLGRTGKVDVSNMLLWLLRSDDQQVRRQALDIVQEIGAPLKDMWPRILKLLRDADWWVRERVVDVLADIAGTELTRHVVAYLDDPSDVVRRYAVEVLMRVKDPRSLGALLKTATEDQDWWARERAVEAMGVIGDPRVVPHIIKLAEDSPELVFPAVQALGDLRQPSSLSFLCGAFQHADPDVRLEAVRAVKKVGDVAAAPYLKQLVADPELRVQEAARDLLLTWHIQLEGAERVGSAAERLSRMEQILVAVDEAGADDLFLLPEQPPYIKVMGETVPLSDEVLSAEDVQGLLRPLLTPVQMEMLAKLKDVDFSCDVESANLRFRANVLRQVRGWQAVFRRINNRILNFEALQLPPVVERLCNMKDGLVLVGGPTGSGKSTTLAAMIDYINHKYARHIITIEDPIEVVHEGKRSMVTQREVGKHTGSLHSALRATLREDPDVILVGELRDAETIGFAVSAAETGHLVFGTLHTVSAHTTVDRLINAFPAGQQDQIRAMLAQSLKAVLCQQLIRRSDGRGRIAAVEVLLNNDAVSNLLRKGQAYQLPSVILTHRDQGMQSMDHELMRLYRQGLIDAEEAYLRAVNKKDFEAMMVDTGVVATGAAPAVEPAAPAAADPYSGGGVPADPYGGGGVPPDPYGGGGVPADPYSGGVPEDPYGSN